MLRFDLVLKLLRFAALQQHGLDLAGGDGQTPLREADALPFTDKLLSFAQKQEELIQDAERQLKE
eukprot:1744872-Amphidinium_carterae.1